MLMKMYKMLGVYSKEARCCVLVSKVPFDMLSNENIKKIIITHYSTNWNGCDSIARTLDCENLKQTGRKFKLKNKITYNGTDNDMGTHYYWSFTFDEIRELE